MRAKDGTVFEVEKKLPVRHAISDLFLDTELQAKDYRRIAMAWLKRVMHRRFIKQEWANIETFLQKE